MNKNTVYDLYKLGGAQAVKAVLNLMSRKHIRDLALAHQINPGRDKQHTVENIATADSSTQKRITILWDIV